MVKAFARLIVVGALMLPLAAQADPITLKLSFFTSDRSNIYQNSIKPFVDAVNKDGKGIVEIKVYFSGAISGVQAQQPQLVADGTADMAIIVPGQSPDRFGDTSVMELPGIYRDSREAGLVFTRLIEAGALNGYGDFFVVGAFVSAAESIHSRKSIATNEDLKGLTIRTNNNTEAAVLQKLGALPVLLAINQTTEAISRDKIDGATAPPSMLFEFGIGRVTSNHYMIPLGGAPTALVMNRAKFDSLPPQAKAIIRQYSGAWLAEQSATGLDALDKQTLKQLQEDPRRKVVFLSPADLKSVQQISASVVEAWAAMSRHNRELLDSGQGRDRKTPRRRTGQRPRASTREIAMAYLADISFRRAIGFLLLVLAILAGGTWITVKVTTDHLVDSDATSNARDWAKFIAANVTDLEQIANGEQPSAASLAFFEATRKAGQVFRYLIFNREGYSQLVSDHDRIALVDLSEFNAKAARAGQLGLPVVDVKTRRWSIATRSFCRSLRASAGRRPSGRDRGRLRG